VTTEPVTYQTPRTAVVANPSTMTDRDATQSDIRAALAGSGWPEPLWLETTPEDPGRGQTRQAIEAGVEIVFACGGDGTVMACATELAGSAVALAVLPVGTGNLLARNLDIPVDVVKALAVAVGGGRRRIDVGAVDGQCFTIMAGMGFDAHMMGDAPDAVKARIGWPAYVLSAIGHLKDRPMRVSVRLDGDRQLSRRARTVLVANVGRLQGGVSVLPDAEPDDGELDVAIIAPLTLRDWVALAWGVMWRHQRVAMRETFRARQVEIESDRVQPRQLDGDVIAPGRTLVIEVRPSALTICVPLTEGQSPPRRPD
jgi:YegS/Rv2252/BmrU family lipid kinase